MGVFDGVAGSQARIYVDEFELTQQSSGAELAAEAETISYNIMGESSAHQDVTTPSFSIPHHGYYTGHGLSADLGYFEETLQKRLGTTDPVVVTLKLGPVTYTLIGTWGSQLTIDAPVDGLITVDGNWAAPDQVIRGVASDNASYTNGQNGVPVDLGATGVANGVVFHVSGFPDLTAGAEVVTVKVQTSASSGGTYVDWLTTTFKKPGAKLVTGASNPNRWVRVVVSFTAGVAGPVSAFASIKNV